LDKVRIPVPCFPGDTVFARSIVLELHDGGEALDAGRMRYAIELRNQHGELVCTLEREVSLKKRAVWAAKDSEFTRRWW
jgi:acyl dehydratase